MNNNILKKCLEELNKENPRKDYVIGMLETLIDVGGSNQTRDIPYASLAAQNIGIIPDMNNFPVVPTIMADETSDLVSAYTHGSVKLS